MRTLPQPYSTGGCFFCGPKNPMGLHLTFQVTETEPNELVCRWVPPAHFRGLGRILHGGIQSGLFDEIMGWAAMHLTGEVGVTSSLQVEFLKPLFTEQEIEIRCRIASRNGSRVNLSGEIKDQNGTFCTKAAGTYVLVSRDRFDTIVGEE
jgi:acyl-coenzyme A thioesterase PaaI-like protein